MFKWDRANANHLLGHGVRVRECEQAVDDPYALSIEAYELAGEPRFGVLGETEDGRLLRVIYTWRGERRRVITAFPASRRDQRVYDEWKH